LGGWRPPRKDILSEPAGRRISRCQALSRLHHRNAFTPEVYRFRHGLVKTPKRRLARACGLLPCNRFWVPVQGESNRGRTAHPGPPHRDDTLKRLRAFFDNENKTPSPGSLTSPNCFMANSAKRARTRLDYDTRF
jgi:hypothetical protein